MRKSWFALVLGACGPSEGTLDPLPLPSLDLREVGNVTAVCAHRAGFGGAGCVSTERALAAGDEEAVGFEPQRFVDLVSGEHRAELVWSASGAPAARGELVLTVEPLGPVRYLERSSASSGMSEQYIFGNTGARYLSCGDRLALAARIEVASADGALNETLEGTFEAESGHFARSLLRLANPIPRSLERAVREAGSDPASTELVLVAGISDWGLEASVAAHSTSESLEVEAGRDCVSLGEAVLDARCGLSAITLEEGGSLLGLSYDAAITRLNATSPAQLDTGAQLSLQAEASTTGACVSIDSPATLPLLVEFPGQVRLASSDGRVDGSIDVQMVAEALGGALTRVSADSEYLAPDTSGLSELAPSFAIREPLAWSTLGAGGFEFRVEAREAASGGLLRAIGSNLECQGARPCQEVCPGPGCTATTAEKWAVRWGTLPVGASMPLEAPAASD